MNDQPMKLCQSCGMPMSDNAPYGTEADGSKSDDYCAYCYKDGKFTDDCSMDKMIDFCVEPTIAANPSMTEAQARAGMRKYFPALKRWAQQ